MSRNVNRLSRIVKSPRSVDRYSSHQPTGAIYAIPRRFPAPREHGQGGDHRGPVWPRVDAAGLPRGHPGDHGRTGAEGGRLLQRRRHRAAPARARARRQGLQAPVQVQRADRRRARRGAGHDHPGRRFDLVRAGRRRPGGQVAVRRHPPHAGGAAAQAGPGHRGHQHHADEHHGAALSGVPEGDFAGAPGLPGRLPRDDGAGRPGLGRRAPAPAAGVGHPAAFPADRHACAGNAGAPGARGRLHRSAQPDLDRHRRRLRRPQPVQLLQLRAPRPGRLHADRRVAAEERAAVQHDGDGDGPASALRHRGHHHRPAWQPHDLGAADRAVRARGARTGPRNRLGPGSARDLPHRHLVRQCRGHAAGQRHGPQPQVGAEEPAAARGRLTAVGGAGATPAPQGMTGVRHASPRRPRQSLHQHLPDGPCQPLLPGLRPDPA
ncbi:hypothetical protein CBM2586_B10500 [Cupriavidus phytorum]|uniref:Uncharacterized protein n=1 Tax=Cupriavidus taiwanensis TaxID=164546 RepID=A0A975XEZ7_9BURK|nr:hypothetical protein CBM2586_B10500 [Cupriavidus taiwanensis]